MPSKKLNDWCENPAANKSLQGTFDPLPILLPQNRHRLKRPCTQALAPRSSDMAKVKKKFTLAQKTARKAAKAERQRKYEWVFINGKQVRIKRPPTVDGMPVDQFIEENADLIWLHQNEMWELMPDEETTFGLELSMEPDETEDEDGIPF